MSNPNGVAPFADNWAYLKTELSWLDRLLMVAVSRQKRELQELDDFATSSEDRVTSHWWKGIIAINGQPGYDHARPPKTTANKGAGYAQQLEARIQASQQQGVILALPWLRERLQLSLFEKNVILLALAPEINQRFGRLYSYLQYQHDESDWDLPTVDLCLKLLCRNDIEWRRSRPLLAADSPLLNLGLVEWVNADDTTVLSRHLRITEDLANYLLAETPDPNAVTHLANPLGAAWASGAMPPAIPADTWTSLVLPASTLAQLHTVSSAAQAGQSPQPMVLLAGPPGTGKTKAARVLAAQLNLPLIILDLAAIPPADLEALWDVQPPGPSAVWLIKSAQTWLGREPTVEVALVQQWLNQRRCPAEGGESPGLALFTTHHLQTIKPSWRQAMTGVIEFAAPTVTARKTLWQQAIPAEIKVDRRVRWPQVAKQLALTGGEITALAGTAVALAQQATPPTLTLAHLQQALALHHPAMTLSPPKATASKRPKSK